MRARGARNVHVAPQAVDNAFWSAPVTAVPGDLAWPRDARVKFMFAGRPDREKGVGVLMEAWRRRVFRRRPPRSSSSAGIQAPLGPGRRRGGPPGVSCIEPVPPERLRELYADADVLVVPSITTPTFREPWGLVVNEAMNRGLATIASDAVGAVAGGLVRDGHNGLVVPAGDSDALARAMRPPGRRPRAARPPGRRGGAGRAAPTRTTPGREGFSQALATLGLSRAHW